MVHVPSLVQVRVAAEVVRTPQRMVSGNLPGNAVSHVPSTPGETPPSFGHGVKQISRTGSLTPARPTPERSASLGPSTPSGASSFAQAARRSVSPVLSRAPLKCPADSGPSSPELAEVWRQLRKFQDTVDGDMLEAFRRLRQQVRTVESQLESLEARVAGLASAGGSCEADRQRLHRLEGSVAQLAAGPHGAPSATTGESEAVHDAIAQLGVREQHLAAVVDQKLAGLDDEFSRLRMDLDSRGTALQAEIAQELSTELAGIAQNAEDGQASKRIIESRFAVVDDQLNSLREEFYARLGELQGQLREELHSGLFAQMGVQQAPCHFYDEGPEELQPVPVPRGRPPRRSASSRTPPPAETRWAASGDSGCVRGN